MSVETVAILSPGDMGHAVGRVLKEHALRVTSCLEGRSRRTRELASRAGIEAVPSLEGLLEESDLVLSIVPPSEAFKLAQKVANVLQTTGANTYFADCNAVSPQTAKEIGGIINGSGGRFIDASIIGSPPGKDSPPRFYASGRYANIMHELDGKGIDVRVMQGEIGRASAIKMCYAALTKGSIALWIAVLIAAKVMGLSEELREEFLQSQPGVYKQMEKQVPGVPPKARRWVGEMEEIASTFQRAELTPEFHIAASKIFRLVGQTPLAEETPEDRDTSRTLEQTIDALACGLNSKMA